MAAVVAAPIKFGVTGIGLFRFGDDLYSEQVACVAFANTFGLASLGLKLNYIQYNATGYGTKQVLSVGFGGIARITSQLSIGTYITNLNQPLISKSDQERLPTRLTAGIALKPSETVVIITEIEKDLDHKSTWKTGLEYDVNKKFSARTGFSLQPDAAYLGFGFKSNKLNIDYALQYHALLGSSHQATVGYRIKARKK
jgi:hypothetical protein